MRPILFTILMSGLFIQTSIAQKNAPAIESIYVSQISPIDSLEILNRKELGTGESTILADNILEGIRIINERQLLKPDHAFLLDVLLNENEQNDETRKFACYTPNYGILFFDKTGGLIGFIELSTTCKKYKTTGITSGWEMNLDSSDYSYLESWFEENFKEE